MSITYKDSGVDKAEGYRLVEKAKTAAQATHSDRVLGGIGSFAALYDIGGYQNPVLVSGTDGVLSKPGAGLRYRWGRDQTGSCF